MLFIERRDSLFWIKSIILGSWKSYINLTVCIVNHDNCIPNKLITSEIDFHSLKIDFNKLR